MQTQQTQEQQASTQTNGPVELDISLLQFVSGGAPRTTWSVIETAEAESVSAPRTTW